VAHEVRNPIMSIGGFAARMKAGLDRDHQFHRYLDIILEETAKLEKLVRDVKELAGMHTADLQPADMNSLLSEVIANFSPIISGRSIQLGSDIQESLPPIVMDTGQVSRALKNIIQNSIEAMPNGGTIKLTARPVDTRIRIVIEDSGIGIEEAKLDTIQEPFVTSKTTGAGLGLTMVYQIVMNHQGEIHITSRGGKGTVVTLDLPLNSQS
jgi:two-component system, sporulation sensor kinase E